MFGIFKSLGAGKFAGKATNILVKNYNVTPNSEMLLNMSKDYYGLVNEHEFAICYLELSLRIGADKLIASSDRQILHKSLTHYVKTARAAHSSGAFSSTRSVDNLVDSIRECYSISL